MVSTSYGSACQMAVDVATEWNTSGQPGARNAAMRGSAATGASARATAVLIGCSLQVIQSGTSRLDTQFRSLPPTANPLSAPGQRGSGGVGSWCLPRPAAA